MPGRAPGQTARPAPISVAEVPNHTVGAEREHLCLPPASLHAHDVAEPAGTRSRDSDEVVHEDRRLRRICSEPARRGEERVGLRQDAELLGTDRLTVDDFVEEKRKPGEVEHRTRVLADRDDRPAKAGVPCSREVLPRRAERRDTLAGENRAQRSLLVVRETVDGLGVGRIGDRADLEADPAAAEELADAFEPRATVDVALVVVVRIERHDLVRRESGAAKEKAVERLGPGGTVSGDAVGEHAVELEDARFERRRQAEHRRADRAEEEAWRRRDEVLPGKVPEQAERCRLLGDERLPSPPELVGRKIRPRRPKCSIGCVERCLPGQREAREAEVGRVPLRSNSRSVGSHTAKSLSRDERRLGARLT